jgi:hypothetical protein
MPRIARGVVATAATLLIGLSDNLLTMVRGYKLVLGYFTTRSSDA